MECQGCGATNHLVKHHVTYVPELIQILCRECHKKVHVKRGIFQRPPGFVSSTGTRYPRKERSALIEVSVFMSPKFLEKIDNHLKAIGITNRSGWVNTACLSHVLEEAAELREE